MTAIYLQETFSNFWWYEFFNPIQGNDPILYLLVMSENLYLSLIWGHTNRALT